jgi:peptidoglycan/xylan/chitin deacetylase (PgdA/CDA1 family)
MIEIALRFDDPSPTSDHALERGIFAILRDLGIPATVAVVPTGQTLDGTVPITRDNVAHLVKACADGVIEVAQHGYSHAPLTTTAQGSPSEFCGVPGDEQARHIDLGRILLEAAFAKPVTGFIPPWNTYDEHTLQLLSTRRYSYISGSYVTPAGPVRDLVFIPRSSHISHLREAIREARRTPFLPAVIVAIMHHYDFREAREKPGSLTLEDFQTLLAWAQSQSDIHFTTLGQLSKKLPAAKSWSILDRHLKKEKLHWRLQRCLPRHLLMTRPMWLYLRPPGVSS